MYEKRLYFFVPYNISPIQQAIQAGHAALEYAYEYGDDIEYQEFIKNWKTWIILNGGTTNNRFDLDGVAQGSMNQIVQDFLINNIKHSTFQEPDLNDALTAICFLVDECVFNREDYPDFVDFILYKMMYPDAAAEVPAENIVMLKTKSNEELEKMFPEYYRKWVTSVGGKKNVFLRELLKNKKLA